MDPIALRRAGLVLSGLLAALLLISSARAGGWSVVTLDSGGVLDSTSGATIQPGVPFSFGFTVLQHGRTPVGGLAPTITATNQATGAVVETRAEPEGAVGHYVATLSLPSAGSWSWQIAAFGPPAPMAPITVVAPAAAPALALAPAGWPIWAALLLVLAGGAWLLVRRRARRPSVA